ncbi:hypothetical protein PHLCEN_2v3846 [Hermanssonia centrifuga]|uniref:Transcription factor TFIIIB component B'' Myb domain-containing protein n=1 Tax=Hermanssonia centrifuga TaxID=98765 RepID=A0A2R6QBG7_9APHY|nr:hypothetical protein PHLCEN_2v3846 [Hermanssonia centrifuga]
MSTRVQKGGPVFKPIAKPRPRHTSETRQTSLTPDPRLLPSSNGTQHMHHGSPLTTSEAASSMPPPSTIPHAPGPGAHTEGTTRPSNNILGPTLVNSRQDTNGAFAITTPSRDYMRHHTGNTVRPFVPVQNVQPPAVPPAVAINTQTTSETERISTALYPQPVHTGVPIPIATPNRSDSTDVAPLPSATDSAAGYSTALISHPMNDSQIDPALLEAVVTALQHADQAQQVLVESSQGDGQMLAPNAVNVPQPRRESAGGVEANRGQTTSVSLKPKRGRPRRSLPTNDEISSIDGENQISEGRRTRRKIRRSAETPDGDDLDSFRKRPRKQRSRAPSLPPYDPAADPGEEIDPTAVTMAELCDDTGRGRVSSKAMQIMSNHAAWRAANKGKRERMRANMEAKKYGRTLDEDGNGTLNVGPPAPVAAEQHGNGTTVGQSAAGPSSRGQSPDADGQKGDDYDYTQALATSRYNVQVRVGPNGETIIDETSLFVDRQEEDDTAGYTHIEESDTTKFVNSASYSKKLRGSRWTAEETDLFYNVGTTHRLLRIMGSNISQALSQFGENYELISYVLPGRDRKACKNKFKAEDKRDPARITYCLKNRIPYDMATLTRLTGKDFSGPTPEIRAPTPLRMPTEANEVPAVDTETAIKTRKQSKTPRPDRGEEEIIGSIEELDAS